MKKSLIIILVVALLFTGCVSSDEKKIVRNTLEEYFSALQARDYEKANSMVIRAQQDIYAEIEDSGVNDLLFEDIYYELWDISKTDDGLLMGEVIIEQLSLKTAYVDTVKEYAAYVENANATNKQFTDEALEVKWNEIFYKHVSKVEETVTMKCDVYIYVAEDASPKIMMTADFRNCLFGGELDAIKMLNERN